MSKNNTVSHAPRFSLRPLALALLSLAAGSASKGAWADTTVETPTITIIGTTPLPGLGLSREVVPAPVQTATGDDIRRSRAQDLPDFMNRQLGSVHVTETQGNSFQGDLNYRGYSASPLLGTPQGLSVYMDGIRMNQPFGDVVSWDLIPTSAIDTLTLMPGSNPLFGLNTLGGALVIQTKDGRTAPGTFLEGRFGSFGRRTLELSHGGRDASNGLHWYVNTDLSHENGWREDSPSTIRRIFSKLGWQDARSELALTLAHANNTLKGNGLQEKQLLEQSWNSVYTKPDITENRSTLLNLTGRFELDDQQSLSGNAYYRDIRTSTYNADINEDSLDQAVYQPSLADRNALTAAGYTGFPVAGANASNTPFPFWRCIAQALQRDEPAEKCNGLINRGESTQQNYGASGQWSRLFTLAGMQHQLSVGGGYDASKVRFNQSTELGYLNPDRTVTGVGAFGDGVTGGDVNGAPYDVRVNLKGRMRTWSLFGTDTLALSKTWSLTASARYNLTRVENRDQIHDNTDPASLSSDSVYRRINPSLGLAWAPTSGFSAYGGYSEGSRAPSAIELGCANPNQPCKLPNSMAGDPPLKQVVAKTWEAGFRGGASKALQWSAGAFRADNLDDILFVASPQTGYGYFQNFGKTRRQGLELGVSGSEGKFSFSANYTLLDATYQSSETVNGSANSSNSAAQAGNKGVDGNIQIRPGDRIPMIPRQMLKLAGRYQATGDLALGLNMVAMGSSYARGNENNAHQADGVYYLGSGKNAGYAIFNFDAQYEASPQLELLFQVNNLLNKRYSTAAQLGANGFTANGNYIARPFSASGNNTSIVNSTFYAPGAERNFWVGFKYAFDKPAK